MYGLRYKSTNPNEPIREVNLEISEGIRGPSLWGKCQHFRANAWLQAGKKTERFKRSLVSSKALTGQLSLRENLNTTRRHNPV